jgi:hypothetical protein
MVSTISPVIATPNYQYTSPLLVNCPRISGRRADRRRMKILIISCLTRSDDAVPLGCDFLARRRGIGMPTADKTNMEVTTPQGSALQPVGCRSLDRL